MSLELHCMNVNIRCALFENRSGGENGSTHVGAHERVARVAAEGDERVAQALRDPRGVHELRQRDAQQLVRLDCLPQQRAQVGREQLHLVLVPRREAAPDLVDESLLAPVVRVRSRERQLAHHHAVHDDAPTRVRVFAVRIRIRYPLARPHAHIQGFTQRRTYSAQTSTSGPYVLPCSKSSGAAYSGLHAEHRAVRLIGYTQ